MTLDEVMLQLQAWGSEQTKKVLLKHGAKEPFYGVKVADLKKIQKKEKKNTALALELYKTGNSDAMYLAGMITDAKAMTPAMLQDWVENAYWYYISDFAVAGVAAESNYAVELGLSWIDDNREFVQSAGWATLAGKASITPDEELDLALYESLLDRCEATLHDAQNRVRYAMNQFVISMGCYVLPVADKALEVGASIGKVNVDMGGTACKVPLADAYIKKVADKGRAGKKRKTTIC